MSQAVIGVLQTHAEIRSYAGYEIAGRSCVRKVKMVRSGIGDGCQTVRGVISQSGRVAIAVRDGEELSAEIVKTRVSPF
jgi:hypothetical protein